MNRNAACLVPSLGLPIGFVYFWSRNVTYFTGTAVLVSALTLLAACALLYCLNAFVIARLTGRFLPQRAGRLIFALLMGAEFAFGAFWLVNYHLPYQRSLWSVAALAAVALLVLVRKEKVLTVFLGALLLISGSLYVFNFTVYSAQQARLLKEIGSNVENIVFKKRPNIYIYLLESFQDFELLEKIYGVDCSGLEKFLLENGFVIQEKTYSSAGHTIESLAQLFTGREIPRDPIAQSDALWEIRRLIGGSEHNTFFRVLKNNGYTTYFLTEIQQYLFSKKEEYLDEVAVADRKITDFLPLVQFMYQDILDALHCDPRIINFEFDGINGYPLREINPLVKHAMQRGIQHQPYMILFRGGAEHTPVTYDMSQREEWIASQSYQKLVKQSNLDTEKLITYILEHDKDAIIILMGDHGPITYRGWSPPGDAREKSGHPGPSLRDVFDDTARVLFAWRLPGGDAQALAAGKYMNNLNLMWHLFSWLADDPALLEKRATAVTKIGPYTMIEGGDPR